ncbi:MAG: hypothetical protein QGG74_01850 [Phycisphaerales bacterium]|jgi:hypothetical protein|nr:hypothetical protein [Phycisphaerales bacterium]
MFGPRLLLILPVLLPIACDEGPPPPPAPGGSASTPTIVGNTTRRGLGAVDATVDQEDTAFTPEGPPPDPRSADFVSLRAPTDPTWRWEPPRNDMRKINWVIPGVEGEEPAELVVTHFPEASGNTTTANIERWTSQFRGDDLAPQPDITQMEVSGMPVTLVELRGQYRGMGGGWHKDDYTMLVAMVTSPHGSVFIKLLGPTDTVSMTRTAFMDMIEGLKPTG